MTIVKVGQRWKYTYNSDNWIIFEILEEKEVFTGGFNQTYIVKCIRLQTCGGYSMSGKSENWGFVTKHMYSYLEGQDATKE